MLPMRKDSVQRNAGDSVVGLRTWHKHYLYTRLILHDLNEADAQGSHSPGKADFNDGFGRREVLDVQNDHTGVLVDLDKDTIKEN